MGGVPAPNFTYTSPEKLFARYAHRLEKYGATSKQVWLQGDNGQRLQSIPMHSSFEAFVSSIAHGLRFQLMYRKDGGAHARGLVVANGTLRRCHDKFRELEIRDGEPVPMRITMKRQNASKGQRDAIEILFEIHYSKLRHLTFVPDPVNADEFKVRDEREAIWFEALFEARRQLGKLQFERDRILVDRLLDFLIDQRFHRIDDIWIFNGKFDRYLQAPNGRTADREFGSGITEGWISKPLPFVFVKLVPLKDHPDALGREMLSHMKALARQIDTTMRIARSAERGINIQRHVVPLGGLLSGGKDWLARPMTGYSRPRVIKTLWAMRDRDDPNLLAPYKIMRGITLDNYMGTYK